MDIITAAEARTDFAAWWADPAFTVEDHPYCGGFGRSYYPQVAGAGRRDASFAIAEHGRPLLLAACSVGAGRLDWFGMPLRLFPRRDLAPDVASGTIRAAFTHLDDLAEREAAPTLAIADDGEGGQLSLVGEQCLNRRMAARVRLTAIATLTEGEAGLRRGLRKSYKSLLNWGQRNLEIRVVDAAAPDRAAFDLFQDFHRVVAGRVTRPQESWDAMYAWIANGGGELVLANLDGELVAGTMVVDGKSVAAYASGVYDRERFDKPMAHWPLWVAMLRAAGRGRAEFDLGEIPLAGTVETKEFNIGYFKQGFATSIRTALTWTTHG